MNAEKIVDRVVAKEGWSWKRMRRTYYWVQVAAGNNEVLCTSESYTTDAKCDQTGEQVARQLGVPYVDEGSL